MADDGTRRLGSWSRLQFAPPVKLVDTDGVRAVVPPSRARAA